MVTAEGSGYSRWDGLAVTRWREDAALDDGGTYLYLRDDESGALVGDGPTYRPRRQGLGGQLRQRRRLHTPRPRARGDDNGRRRRGRRRAAPDSRRQPGGKRANARRRASPRSCSRRRRPTPRIRPSARSSSRPRSTPGSTRSSRRAAQAAPTTASSWLFHCAAVHGASTRASFETDRLRFIGRGRDCAMPAALVDGAPLSGGAGPVLDAIAAARVALRLPARGSLVIDWFTGIAATRDACAALARSARSRLRRPPVRACWRLAQGDAATLGADAAEAHAHERIASAVLYADPALRGDPSAIAANRRGQSGLWGFGISGDLPLCSCRSTMWRRSAWCSRLVRAQAFCRAHDIGTELMVVSGAASRGAGRLAGADPRRGRGKRRRRSAGQARAASSCATTRRSTTAIARCCSSVARVAISALARRPSASRSRAGARRAGAARNAPPRRPGNSADRRRRRRDREPLLDFNGYGGFSPDRREYVIVAIGRASAADAVDQRHRQRRVRHADLRERQRLDLERERARVPAHAVVERPGERRRTPKRSTSATRRPAASGRRRCCRHEAPAPTSRATASATASSHTTKDGIASELCVYVAIDAPVKFSALDLRNPRGRAAPPERHRLFEWVLGDERRETLMQVVTELDAGTKRPVRAQRLQHRFRRPLSPSSMSTATAHSACGDRGDFFGRNGSLAAPAALAERASVGHASAPDSIPAPRCASASSLAPAKNARSSFALGAGKSADEARVLVQRWRGDDAGRAALEATKAYWDAHARRGAGAHARRGGRRPGQRLAALPGVASPPVGAHRLLSIERRLRFPRPTAGRDGGGPRRAGARARAPAALGGTPVRRRRRPALVASAVGQGRAHPLLRRLSVAALRDRRYVEVTGDAAVLDEICAFLDGRPLQGRRGSRTTICRRVVGRVARRLYEHCVRAIRHGLRYGAHGLPLMGAGDWNDGMNLVGDRRQGRERLARPFSSSPC